MPKEIKQEDLWDWICSQIGFNKKGKEIQKAIKKFIEGEKKNWEKELAETFEGIKAMDRKEKQLYD